MRDAVDPGLRHGRPRRVVRVEDRPPLGVDLVHVVAVERRMQAVVGAGRRARPAREAARARSFVSMCATSMRNPSTPRSDQNRSVRTKSARTSGLRPVQVGLLDREVVQIPLAVGDALPRRAAERRDPVGRRLGPIRAAALAEDVAVAGRGPAAGGERLLEPLMQVGRVVGHDVDHDPDAGRVQRRRASRRSRRACRDAGRRRGSRRRHSRRRPGPRDRTGSARPRRFRVPSRYGTRE